MSTTNSTDRLSPARPVGGYKTLKQTPDLTYDVSKPLTPAEQEELDEFKILWEYEQQLQK